MRFFVRTSNYQNSRMLNMCDEDLLGRVIKNGDHEINISKSYYGQQIVEQSEAETLMKNSSILNLVGKETIDISVNLKIGSRQGIKIIDDVPFLIIFKM